MKKHFTQLALTVTVFVAAQSALAADPAGLARDKACLACHSVDKKLVGPAFKDIASKYKGDAAATASLAKKIQTGGKGAWGPVPMPPNASVSDADAATLVEWIMSQ